MHLIKFLYNFLFLPPGCFIFLLIVFGFYLRQRRGRSVLFLSAFLLYFLSNGLVSDGLLRGLENVYQPPKKWQADVLIVLGGGAVLDTPNLHGKGHLSGYAANRLLTALQLYHQRPLPIIFSGGQVYASSGREAMIAARIMQDIGVPKQDICLEERSLNTTENAYYTVEILKKYEYQQPLLITSAFHLPRAVKQFAKYGIKVIPYPTDYQVNGHFIFSAEKLLPTADHLHKTSLALKEYLGLLAVKFY